MESSLCLQQKKRHQEVLKQQEDRFTGEQEQRGERISTGAKRTLRFLACKKPPTNMGLLGRGEAR